MQLTINITKEVLQHTQYRAKDNNIGQNCAIGHAINQLFPNSWVSISSIYFFEDKYIREYPSGNIDGEKAIAIVQLPKVAMEFIARFDAHLANERAKMKPISFEIDVPDNVIELIDINYVYDILSISKTISLAPEVNPQTN